MELKEKITLSSLLECSETEIIFLDENDIEYRIEDVHTLFLGLSKTEDIIDEQIMDAMEFMSIEDFLKEFKTEFIDIMILYAQFYPEYLIMLSTKI